MPTTIKKIKNILMNSFDSPKRIIPSIAVPTAPIPVQIAYAVPIGIDLTAADKKKKLKTIPVTVITLGQSLVNPFVYFNPTAQPISKIPAMKRCIQAMLPQIFRNKYTI